MAKDWKIYRLEDKSGKPKGGSSTSLRELLDNPDYCPPWRNFAERFENDAERRQAVERSGNIPPETDERGAAFVPDEDMVDMVNAALYLRRPLLITGLPGTGKSSLIHSVARQLSLGRVLRWPITSRTTLRDGLYQYDAIGRLQEWQLKKMRYESLPAEEKVGQAEIEIDIGEYLTLGPLGTAMLPWSHPRALLIDEIDKGDPDLANDLLNVLEEGNYEIPELARLGKDPRYEVIGVPKADGGDAKIVKGRVQCLHFPFVILTSNGERDFPPAFLRRCLQLHVGEPEEARLWRIVESHLGPKVRDEAGDIVEKFVNLRTQGLRTNDQLLQAVFLLTRDFSITDDKYRQKLIESLLASVSER